MALLDDIIRGEIEFPRALADVAERPYGLLYHNDRIPDSYDGNHACILRAEVPEEIAEAVADVKAFYLARGLTPRVYHLAKMGTGAAGGTRSQSPFSQTLRAALAAGGFAFNEHASTRFFVRQRAPRFTHLPDVPVCRVESVSPELAAMVERSNCARAMKVLRRRIRWPQDYFFVAHAEGEPVAMACLQDIGRASIVDEVLTDVRHRGRGYCRAVINTLVAYHARHMSNLLYLYADNPSAIRIYEEAGFIELDEKIENWSAWMPEG